MPKRKLTTRTKLSQVLQWARDDIAKYGWTQHASYRDPKHSGDPSECCASGAIHRATGSMRGRAQPGDDQLRPCLSATAQHRGIGGVLHIEAVNLLASVPPTGFEKWTNVTYVNDDRKTDKKKVLRWFDRAIRKAQAEGK